MLDGPVDETDEVQAVLVVKAPGQLEPAPVGKPAVALLNGRERGERVAQYGERRVFAREVARRGVFTVQKTILNRVERFGHADDRAAWQHLDVDLAVGRFSQRVGHLLKRNGGSGVFTQKGLHPEPFGLGAAEQQESGGHDK